ncbi:MAG: hypothetical protein ACP5FU_06790, partial [Nitrososphaeria archaeon]
KTDYCSKAGQHNDEQSALVAERKLRKKAKKLGDLFAEAFNELNYTRRQQFFSGQRMDFEGTAKAVYEKYKSLLGSANVQQLINKNKKTCFYTSFCITE